ncbi:ABC-2 family transporter protein [Candidatus Dojkabacteria bacterium]|nr:ABC-2 family transporter protein [Candidatus Dojkabacteria bacterium]
MKKYFEILKIKINSTITEKEIILIWSFSSFIILLGSIAFWTSSGTTQIGSYTNRSIPAYHIYIFAVREIVQWLVFWEIYGDIRDGRISNVLLKPISYLRMKILGELGYHVVSAVISSIVITALVLLTYRSLDFDVSTSSLLLSVVAFPISIAVTFLLNFIIGCATFFWTESYFLEQLYWIITATFGGAYVPIALYPDKIATILGFSPFRYTYSFPAEIAFRKLDNAGLVLGMTLGIIWVIVLYFLAKLIWKAGLKKYSAFGT